MRKIGKMRRKKQKRIIIISSMCLLFCLCVGYAAFNTQVSLKAKGNIKEKSAADILKENVVTIGDGLYLDSYEEGRYIYKGSNPNNYITFNDETWRILSVESDNTIKIVRSEDLGFMAWDEDESNVWENASLNNYLNNDYYNSFNDLSKNVVIEHAFNIGKVVVDDWFNNSHIVDFNAEKNTQWIGKIGLMTPSEYEVSYVYLNFNIDASSYGLWTINAYEENTACGYNYICTFSDYYGDYNFYDNSCLGEGSYPRVDGYYKVLPTLYLSSDISLSGEGTEINPYVITN